MKKNYSSLRKIFLFLVVLVSCLQGKMYSQCLKPNKFPFQTVPSDNMGLVQTISTLSKTIHYAEISNAIVGSDYIFTCKENFTSANKFITVTDSQNAVMGFGNSPLTVNVTASTIRVHYSDAACAANFFTNHTTTLQVVLTCPVPTGMTLAEATPTSASYIWTSGAVETAWEVLTFPNGTTPPSPTTEGTEVTGNASYTDSTLSPGTPYQFYVRADCGDEFSPWNGPLNFTTPCNAISTFNENFEATPADNLPGCWSKILRGADLEVFADIEVATYEGYSGTHSVRLEKSNSGPNSDIILVSPNLATLSTATHRLKFYAKCPSNGTLQVGSLNTPTTLGDFVVHQEVAMTPDYTEYVVDFTNYSGTDSYIGIRHNISGSTTTVLIDNIRWEVTPTCPDVKDITFSQATTESVTLNWTAGNTETEWDVVYSTDVNEDLSSLSPVNPAPTVSPSTAISGLTANTAYHVWVRSVCGENDGAWIGPTTFTTPCVETALLNETVEGIPNGSLPECWSSVLKGNMIADNAAVGAVDYAGHMDSNSMKINFGTSSPDADIILVSPSLSTLELGTYRLRFYGRADSGTMSLQVGTMDSPTTGGNFTSFEAVEVTSGGAEYVIDFTGYTTTNNFIAFRHNSPSNLGIFVDNIVWEPAPLCPDVSLINSVASTTTAIINWMPNGDETQWDVVYGDMSVTDPNLITPISPSPTVTPQATLSELIGNTSYKVWVRSVCGSNNGYWVGPVIFKTLCGAMAAFEEDFDGNEYPDSSLPDCWSSILRGEGISENATVETTFNTAHTPPSSVRIFTEFSGPGTELILVSPNLGTSIASATQQLRFYAESESALTLEVGTLNNISDTATFTVFDAVDLVPIFTPNGTEYTVDFSTYTGTDAHIGFRIEPALVDMFMNAYLDNIVWEENLKVNQGTVSTLKCFPNPVKDFLHLSGTENISNVSVFNLLGQKMLDNSSSSDNTQTGIDMSGLSSGTYIVKIVSENQSKTIKIIKQ